MLKKVILITKANKKIKNFRLRLKISFVFIKKELVYKTIN